MHEHTAHPLLALSALAIQLALLGTSCILENSCSNHSTLKTLEIVDSVQISVGPALIEDGSCDTPININ